MAIRISSVQENSIAERLGITPGSTLVSVNGHEVRDLLDYGFYTAAEQVELVVAAGENRSSYQVSKGEYEELGIESESFLMDEQHACCNKCIFCFIDQLPRGMRSSLYFKDDDERLSFLFGNYITLTNLTDRDIDRIVGMKISPVNISVHTVSESLRSAMMGNKRAGESLKYLYELAARDVPINCQIVLCPGINDGPELENTLDTLIPLYPSLKSISVVPVGLTAHRQGLYPLRGYDPLSAAQVLETVGAYNDRCRRTLDTGIVWASDEFYLLAGKPVQSSWYYDDFPQIENGVGMIADFADGFRAEIDKARPEGNPVYCTLVTGTLAEGFLNAMVALARAKNPALRCSVRAVRNDFFGHSITVSGLLTAQDILDQLRKNPGQGVILLPANVLDSQGEYFLDNASLADFRKAAGRPVEVIPDAGTLARYLLVGASAMRRTGHR